VAPIWYWEGSSTLLDRCRTATVPEKNRICSWRLTKAVENLGRPDYSY